METSKKTVKKEENADKEMLLKTIDEICENMKRSLDEQFATLEKGETPPQTEKQPLEETDELYWDVLKYAVETESISVSGIQKQFSIGFIRAKGYIDDFKSKGFIGEEKEENGYPVLLTTEQFNAKFE